jgi:hypothetical protein
VTTELLLSDMARNVSLARRCLETIAENLALICGDERHNGNSIYPNAVISHLSKYCRLIIHLLKLMYIKSWGAILVQVKGILLRIEEL